MRKRISETPREEFITQGKKAADIMKKRNFWSNCSSVFSFLSMENEIDTEPLIQAALEKGKDVFVPKIEDQSLAFYQIHSLDFPFIINSYGIKEPETEKSRIKPVKIDRNFSKHDFIMIICPGLAFDWEGNRLGRGKGYYDRLLEYVFSNRSFNYNIGMCMDFQVIKKVPTGRYDKSMHAVLTGKTFRITTNILEV